MSRGDEAGGGDGVADDELEWGGADDVGIHRQSLKGSDDGDGDDGDLGFDGGVKSSAEKGLEVALGAAAAFGKDDKGHSFFYGLRGGRE